MATNVSLIRGAQRYPQAALHWAKRPLPEPPRTRRVSKWTRIPLDRVQTELEEWLKDAAVGYTFDGE
jgi:hypothetical protein